MEKKEGTRESKKDKRDQQKAEEKLELEEIFEPTETSLFDVVEDDLTMHGLTVIHRFNKENT